MTNWTDVPDPRDDGAPCVARCTVEVLERTWRHIAEKHVEPGIEPWDDWMGGELTDDFRRLWSPGSTDYQREDTLNRVAAVVGQELVTCLAVPLGVLYDDYPAPSRDRPGRPQETWGLVLPSGAFLVVRSRPTGGEVRTCYFMGAACEEPDRARRWRRVVERILLTYARRRDDSAFEPPGPLDQVPTNEGGIRLRVRFRTVATWALDGTQCRPWSSMSNPWCIDPQTSAPTLALLPRRRYPGVGRESE